jgi:hypothetical protein
MAKPLRFIMDFLSYEGVNPTNNPVDAISINKKVEEANVTEVARSQKSIPASTTDLALNLADGTSNDYLLILVDQIVSIKINGSATALTLKPKVSGTKTPAFMIRGSITSLTVTNAGTQVANIDFVSAKI